MNKYQHLSQPQRYQIEALLKAGYSKIAVARQLGVHRSTICREIKRNSTLSTHPPDKYKAVNPNFLRKAEPINPGAQKQKMVLSSGE